MSDDTKLSKAEKALVDALRSASGKTLACVSGGTHDKTKWQLVGVAIELRDRMHGIIGGTVRIAPKAVSACTTEVEQVSLAADNLANGPDFDRVVIEGNQAIDMIDASDAATLSS